MSALEERIRRGLEDDVTVSVDDMLSAAAAGAQRSRRRQRRVVGMGVAAAVLTVIVAGLAVSRSNDNTAPPVGPPSPARTTDTANPMVNGQIQSTDEYLGHIGAVCGGCYWPGSPFDQDTGTVLLIDPEPDGGPTIGGIRVIGRDGLMARLVCPDDFPCPDGYAMSLGPGADEFSVLARRDEVQVMAFDGTVRRRIDLSAALDGDANAYVEALAWSPDGERLAVGTAESGLRRIWLFDRDGAEPHVAYTASGSERFPRLALTGIAWSPDGSRLGFVEAHWNMAAEFGRPGSEIDESTKAVSLSVSEAEQGAPEAATTLYEYPKPHPVYDDDAPEVFLWSPDGTRVAIRFYDQFLELAADDGSVLAEHPFVGGDLIWPARQP
jgi:hypothetical protein